MTVTARYLDAVQSRLGLPSDYALAKHWGVTHQRISEYRRGIKSLGEDRCIQVAEILGIPPETVLFEIQAERARKSGNTKVSEILESVLRRLRTATATLAAASFSLWLLTYGNDAFAMTLDGYGISHSHIYDFGILYIMLNRILAVFHGFITKDLRQNFNFSGLCQIALYDLLLQPVIRICSIKSCSRLHFSLP